MLASMYVRIEAATNSAYNKDAQRENMLPRLVTAEASSGGIEISDLQL